MKLLNLDDVARSNRALMINGEKHDVLEMTVGVFIDTSKLAEKLGDRATFAQQLEVTVEMIRKSIPTLTEESIRGLPIEKLNTLLSFIRGELDEAEEQGNVS